MPISQPNSALARALAHVDRALVIVAEIERDCSIDCGDLKQQLVRAGGALNFAGNSQTKLIEACEAARLYVLCPEYKRMTGDQRKTHDQLKDAVTHASGPGID